METLQTDNRLKCITAGSKPRTMKQVTCSHCNASVRFLLSMPRMCNKCYRPMTFPEHLFAKLIDRLFYYVEGV